MTPKSESDTYLAYLLVLIGLEPCPVKISSLNTDEVQVNPNIGQIFLDLTLCVFSNLLLVNKDEARDPDSSDPSSKKDANKPNTAVESRESSTLAVERTVEQSRARLCLATVVEKKYFESQKY